MNFYKPKNLDPIKKATEKLKKTIETIYGEEYTESSEQEQQENPAPDQTPPGPAPELDFGNKVSDMAKTDYSSKSGVAGVAGKENLLPVTEEELLVDKDTATPFFSITDVIDDPVGSGYLPQPFNAILCNDGTLVDSNTNPGVWYNLSNLLTNPKEGAESYLNSATNEKKFNSGFPTNDFTRILAGCIWTSYNSKNTNDNMGVKFSLVKKTIPQSEVEKNLISINKVKNAKFDGIENIKLTKDFDKLYSTHLATQNSLFKNIRHISATGQNWIKPEGEEISINNIDPFDNEDKNTGVREKIIITTPERSFNQNELLDSDKQILENLRNYIKPTSLATATIPKVFYDYVCTYDTPKFTSFLDSTFSKNPNKNLTVETESVYQYYEPTYETYIADPEVSLNSLPDYNIGAMYKNWSPSAKEIMLNIEANESTVNSAEFDDYYNYVNLNGYIDPSSIQGMVLQSFENGPIKYGSQNYLREWTKGISTFNLKTLPIFNRADDLIFPARSAIVDTLDKEGGAGHYPMYNHIKIKLPNEQVTDIADPERFRLGALTGFLRVGKAAVTPLDHAYLTRILKHNEAAKFDDEKIAYPNIQTQNMVLTKKSYWEDYESNKWWVASPEKAENGTGYNFSVNSSEQNSLQFLEFVTNLMRYDYRMFGYNPGKEEDKTYLSLLKSNNLNTEPALQVIDNTNNQFPLANIFTGLIPNLQKTRTYSEVLSGKLAPSQTVGFRILKYKTDADGNKTGSPVSTYFISNTNGVEDLEDQVFEFFDTRVKYDEKYVYDINALHFIIGTKYIYREVKPVQKRATNFKGPIGAMGNLGLPEMNNYAIEATVDSFPHIKIAEVPYETGINMRVLDKPPLSPEVEPVPYKNVDNRLLWLLRPQLGEVEEVPVLILPGDEEFFRKQYESQYGGVVEGAGMQDFTGIDAVYKGDEIAKQEQQDLGYGTIGVDPITFRGDDLTNRYQLFRLSTPPTTHQDFANAELITEITSDHSTSTSFRDNVKPNQKYYYIFRAIDVHGNLSNPTPIYEVELINDSGTVYVVTKIYEFPKPEKISSKEMKRFISIEPALGQRVFNGALSGISTPFDSDSGEWVTTEGKSKQIKLGVEKESIFGGNKRIKVRLTSKRTNRKLDFNIDFSVKNTETEESKNPDKWSTKPQVGIVSQDGKSEVIYNVCPDGYTFNSTTGECEPNITTKPPGEDECS